MKYNTVFIEIKPEDKINHFLEVDKEILGDKKLIESIYMKKSLYIIHYLSNNNGVCMNFGLFKKVKENKLIHICNTSIGSSRAPILSLDNFKVIGIHKGSSDICNYNIGNLINYPIYEFLKQNK